MYNPVPGLSPNAPANNDYKGGFSTELITKVCMHGIPQIFLYYVDIIIYSDLNCLCLQSKDLGLANGIATASNSPIPMGAIAHQIYRTLQCQGLGGKDFSYVYEFLKNQTKSNQN